VETKIKQVLGSHPWITSFQLCALLDKTDDRDSVRSYLKELLATGEVIGEGRSKGKRYALHGASPISEDPTAISTEHYPAILSAIAEEPGCASRDVVRLTGLAPEVVTRALAEMRRSELFDTSGSRAQMRYWPRGSSLPLPSSPEKSKRPVDVTEAQDDGSDAEPPEHAIKPVKLPRPSAVNLTVAEAVDDVIRELLPIGDWKTPGELAGAAARTHGVSHLRSHERVSALIKEGRLVSEFSNRDLSSGSKEYSGYRVYVRLA
jgi:hypothetical protein